MNDHLLRLAVGSHEAGSGKGCAMNILSWESGDTTITDLPACADPMLARIVQRVNDTHCTHRNDSDLLCPACSVQVLALAHRTYGTSLDWPPADVARVHITLAVEQAESVLHLASSEAPRQGCAVVRRWLAGETVTAGDLRDAAYATAANAYAAYAAAYAANAYAAYAAAYAADAAANAVNAADAAANAVNAANAAANAADGDLLTSTHRIIDRFEVLTGVRAQQPDPEVTRRAITQMTA